MAKKLSLPVLLILLLLPILAACSPKAQIPGHNHPMAPLAEMPDMVIEAPETVQEAFQYAVANPDILSQIPCYCGCGAMGHQSNYDCYVAGETPAGELSFDNHALGCSICVDITQDTMRLIDQGKSMPEILSYVNDTYSRFGPPTTGE